MTLENEIEMYDRAEVSDDTGEIELWDKVIFPNIIRKREMKIIFDVIESVKPRTILDIGCGGGLVIENFICQRIPYYWN